MTKIMSFNIIYSTFYLRDTKKYPIVLRDTINIKRCLPRQTVKDIKYKSLCLLQELRLNRLNRVVVSWKSNFQIYCFRLLNISYNMRFIQEW